jgi:hypothetical protein
MLPLYYQGLFLGYVVSVLAASFPLVSWSALAVARALDDAGFIERIAAAGAVGFLAFWLPRVVVFFEPRARWVLAPVNCAWGLWVWHTQAPANPFFEPLAVHVGYVLVACGALVAATYLPPSWEREIERRRRRPLLRRWVAEAEIRPNEGGLGLVWLGLPDDAREARRRLMESDYDFVQRLLLDEYKRRAAAPPLDDELRAGMARLRRERPDMLPPELRAPPAPAPVPAPPPPRQAPVPEPAVIDPAAVLALIDTFVREAEIYPGGPGGALLFSWPYLAADEGRWRAELLCSQPETTKALLAAEWQRRGCPAGPRA